MYDKETYEVSSYIDHHMSKTTFLDDIFRQIKEKHGQDLMNVRKMRSCNKAHKGNN